MAEGAGWDTPPYEAVLKGDGCLYGRGTDDDKGPVVMALYAMRCVRELGIPMKQGCRLIMGTDEESGSGDLPYYYSKHAPAPNTFTPDSGFPLYNVEKGSYKPVLRRSWAAESALPRVSSIEAVSYTHLDVYKRQTWCMGTSKSRSAASRASACTRGRSSSSTPGRVSAWS